MYLLPDGQMVSTWNLSEKMLQTLIPTPFFPELSLFGGGGAERERAEAEAIEGAHFLLAVDT